MYDAFKNVYSSDASTRNSTSKWQFLIQKISNCLAMNGFVMTGIVNNHSQICLHMAQSVKLNRSFRQIC